VHDYSGSLEAREEAGTPNVVGDIRAALAFLVKDAIGMETMQRRNGELAAGAIAAWSGVERLELLGSPTAPRLPIFAVRMRDGRGGHIHQQLVTRMLSDRFGIQARGGCACAGPYVHRLLGIGPAESDRMRQAILAGDEIAKPGFTRLNFSVLLSEEKVAFILDSVARLAAEAAQHAGNYDCDGARAIFFPRAA
jgi:selenocysteine lyase/cysteine desulfurase